MSAHKTLFSFNPLLDIISVIGIYRILNYNILLLNTNFPAPQTFLNILHWQFLSKFTQKTSLRTAPTNIPTIIVGINYFQLKNRGT